MRFGIFGSCVSRDIISEQRTPDIIVSYYIARSTIRSALSPSCREIASRFAQEVGTNFEDRSFLADLRKTTFQKIQQSSADAVIVDLIDERHATWTDGTHILSDSKGFKSSLGKIDGWERKSAASTHRETVKKAPVWALSLKQALPDTPIVLHRALWATNTDAPADQVNKANAFLSELYDIIEDNIPDIHPVQVGSEYLLSDLDHIWGEAPYHYIPEYYDEIWRQIVALGLDARA